MLRMTVRQEDHGLILKMEGRLDRTYGPEIERCWRRIHSDCSSRPICVDLREVTFIDEYGKNWLRQAARQGATFLASGCLIRAYVDEVMRMVDPGVVQSNMMRKADTMKNHKQVVGVFSPGSRHMVGDGFPVRNIFPSHDLTKEISPFLLLDYAGPAEFSPTDRPRGVGEHPHRGFETVTVVYQGKVAHRDSAGNAGVIGPGDVQWMTAASGVVHEERHEADFARRGGTIQMVQLWVNLPKAFKMTTPRYQGILNADIPRIALGGGAELRLIAGSYAGVKGPAGTFTPVHLSDVMLPAGHPIDFSLPLGFNAAVFVLNGEVAVNDNRSLGEAEMALLTPEGEGMILEGTKDSTLLILGGEPIDEPVARMGPFVMNTQEELAQAAYDYRAGKMGHLD
jgi:quercetin 2,3-dioxygenase